MNTGRTRFKKGHPPTKGNLGRKFSEEWKSKMRGKIPWNKGKKMSKEEYNKGRLDWANDNREKRLFQARKSYLLKRYDLTIDDIDILLKKQENKCAICNKLYENVSDKMGRKKVNFHIDHNHNTGVIRGLLCHNCNIGIGNFHDSIELLRNAIIYLKNDKALSDKHFFND